jgi:hypothetical protein
MQRLFSHTADSGTDNPSGGSNNDNDDEEPYIEDKPVAANVPRAKVMNRCSMPQTD